MTEHSDQTQKPERLGSVYAIMDGGDITLVVDFDATDLSVEEAMASITEDRKLMLWLGPSSASQLAHQLLDLA